MVYSHTPLSTSESREKAPNVVYRGKRLDHCNTENLKIYHDLNAYRVVFDKVGFAHSLLNMLFLLLVLPLLTKWRKLNAS
ncbi:hypothetical protein V6N13_097558 [Hibiscus sabdariffa]